MPSLYETTAAVGDVASSNFTTLYNASNLTVPNAGAGAVSGNLNVGGNLTVNGTSLLQGAVTIGSTLCLPNYCFPLPDGTTYQVLATDGSGNLYWSNITAIPGADYSIAANTTTGGANLTLSNTSGSVVDNVKFAGGTNITVSRTDANTITISTNADDIPNGTSQGQVLYWDGSAWTASSQIRSTDPNSRLISTFESADTSRDVAFTVRRDYDTHAYVNGDSVAISYQFDSDTQALEAAGILGFNYSSTNPELYADTSTDNFATRTNIVKINSTNVEFNGTNLYLNKNHTGAPSSNASINVERGSSTDASLTWNESVDQWQFTNDLYAQGNFSQDGDSLKINADNTNVDSYLYMKGTGEYLKWNNTDTRFEFSDQLYISQTETPAFFERRVVAADVSPSEPKGAIRLFERVTDAGSNATDDAGPSVVFGRTFGASGGSEKAFASMGSVWYGTTNKASLIFNWTTDDFSETTPGVYPQTYALLNLNSDNAKFFNNSLYLNYANVDSTKTATSITGGNTLVFPSAHGYTAGQRLLYQTATQNGLTQSTYYYVIAAGLTATQCQVSTQNGGTAVALTNGTGLTLTFAIVSNRVGINTNTPNYTLDVDGDVNVTGDIYVSGYQIDINSPQAGQAIAFDGTKFINNNIFEYTDTAYRTQVRADIGVAGRTVSAINLFNDTGATAYGQNDGSGLSIGVDSDSQAASVFATMTASYDTGDNHQFRFNTSTNNFAVDTATSITGGNTLVFSAAHGFSANDRLLFTSNTSNGLVTGTYYYVLATGLTATQCQVSLTQGGSAVALTNGTGLTLVFNTSVRIIQADQTNIEVAAQNITLNAANSGVAATDSLITVERGSTGADVALKWNEGVDRWQFTNNGSTYYPMVINIDDLNDVVITSATKGDMLYYNGTDWVNDNRVQADVNTQRATFQYNSNTAGVAGQSALFARRNFTSPSAYANGDGTGLALQLSNDNGLPFSFATFSAAYDSTNPEIRLRTSTDSFVANDVTVAKFNSTNAEVVAQNFYLNYDASTAADAFIYVERGTTGADAFIKWEESNTFWRMSNSLYVDGTAIGGQALATNGNNIIFNFDDTGTGTDSYLTVRRGTNPDVSVRWNEATDRWQTTTNNTTYLNIPNQNLDTTDAVAFSSIALDGTSTYNTETTTLSGPPTAQNISSTSRTTQKVVITITDNVTNHMHVLEALAFQHSGTAYLTTYAEMYTNAALATFTAQVVGGAIEIFALPASSNSTTFKVARVSVD